MPDWSGAKTVVEEDSVRKFIDQSSKKYERFEETWDGLVWLLARSANELHMKSRVVNGVEYCLYKTESIAEGSPSITVLYSQTDTQVVIHGVNINDPAEAAQQYSKTKKAD